MNMAGSRASPGATRRLGRALGRLVLAGVGMPSTEVLVDAAGRRQGGRGLGPRYSELGLRPGRGGLLPFFIFSLFLFLFSFSAICFCPNKIARKFVKS